MKIALIGYGKMGHIIERIALERGHEIVSIIDADNQHDFDSPAFASADIAIEFTSPKSAVDNYLRCFSRGVPVVSGSTGWLDRIDEIKQLCSD
ncbi:MAG: 4-hydroxy-tetrahydrodipicolinate reductase, partial [Muribaculaceae bacterium]